MFTVNDCRVFTCRLPVDFACEQNIYHIGYRQSTVQRFLCIIFNKLTPLPSYLRFFFLYCCYCCCCCRLSKTIKYGKQLAVGVDNVCIHICPAWVSSILPVAFGLRLMPHSVGHQLPSCQSSGCLVAQLPSCHCIFLGKFQWQDNYFRLRIAAR